MLKTSVESNYYVDTRNLIILKVFCWLHITSTADKTQSQCQTPPDLSPCLLLKPDQ